MKIAMAAIVPLVLAACSPLDPLPSGADVLDPAGPRRLHAAPPGPRVAYPGYRVVEPGDWRGVNDAQAGG